MSSAAEQLAANVNMSAFKKADVLKQRLWFTLIALVVYRFGSHIPLPGINPEALADLTKTHSGGILAMFDMLGGGALGRMAIFALNIFPYISASIIMQLMTAIYPPLEAMKKEGESGRKKINQYTRYLTLILATVQAYAMAVGLQKASAIPITYMNPFLFEITAVVTLVGGTLFLMWLGEQITARGIGNGISLIIFAGIVANLPAAIIKTLQMGQTGDLSPLLILSVLILCAAVIAFIVFIERAQRRVIVQYPKRQHGNKMFGGENSHLPLKLNSSGVIPPIFASSLLLLPVTLSGFGGSDGWMANAAYHFSHGRPGYMIAYAALIIFFAFFYTSIVFNPEETSDNLKKSGGFVPGIRPGKNTADHFDYLLTRLTMVGSLYLVAICLLPEFLMGKFSLPFYLGGTSLLIVVSVTMDTVAQVHSHLMAHQYEGLIKKSKGKRRR